MHHAKAKDTQGQNHFSFTQALAWTCLLARQGQQSSDANSANVGATHTCIQPVTQICSCRC